MDVKGSLSSHSKPRRWKIPIHNTKDCKQSADNKVDFNCQVVSKSKSVKTAIVKPFSFAELDPSKELVEMEKEPLGVGQANWCGAIPSARNVEPSVEGKIKREASKHQDMSETKPVVKTFVSKYNAQSGISFMPIPKKCTFPKPFSFREKLKGPSLRTEISSKLSKATFCQTNVFNEGALGDKHPTESSYGKALDTIPEQSPGGSPLYTKVQSKEDKSKAMQTEKLKSGKEVFHKLAKVTTPVFNEAPNIMKNFSGHSGIAFKPRQSSRTTTNPFTTGISTNASTSQCFQLSGNTKSGGNGVPKS